MCTIFFGGIQISDVHNIYKVRVKKYQYGASIFKSTLCWFTFFRIYEIKKNTKLIKKKQWKVIDKILYQILISLS